MQCATTFASILYSVHRTWKCPVGHGTASSGMRNPRPKARIRSGSLAESSQRLVVLHSLTSAFVALELLGTSAA
eukprot:scaffold4026_cov117-Cylindrotheca_fusiformis.AAC.21